MEQLKKKKALLLGDYTSALYHPLIGVDSEIVDIFKDEMSLICIEDYKMLSLESLKEFNLCILYVDAWEKAIEEKLIKDLLGFVERGGGLLVIHNGISFQGSESFAKLIGAKFTGHPPYTNLKIKSSVNNHVIMNGIESFEIDDEPYRFEFDDSVDKHIFMEYIHEGHNYPAGWTRNYGLGRVVYIMPGHQVGSFRNKTYRKIILSSGLWVVG